MHDQSLLDSRQEDVVPGKPRRKRGHALLLTLFTLFCASMACIVIVFDAYFALEATYDDVAATTQERVPLRRAVRLRAIANAETIDGGAADLEAALRDRLEATEVESSTAARASSRHAGGRPDAATPQGRKLYDDLLEAARTAPSARSRSGAIRSLAGMCGQQASDALAGIADDPTQPAEVRELAVNLGRRSVEGSK